MKEDRKESTETAALTGGCAGDAVAAAASKKAPQAVVVNDLEPSEMMVKDVKKHSVGVSVSVPTGSLRAQKPSV